MKRTSVAAIAIVLSVVAHLTLLGSGLLPDITLSGPDDTPVRPLTTHLQKMTVEAAPVEPAPRRTPTAGLVHRRRAASAPVADAHRPAPEQAPPEQEQPAPPQVARDASAAGSNVALNQLASKATPPAEASQPAADAGDDEPQNTLPGSARALNEQHLVSPHTYRQFPRSVRITYRAIYGLTFEATLTFTRTGRHYRLESTLPVASIRYVSEGLVGRNGLRPERFTETRGDTVRSRAEFDHARGVLVYGDGEQQEIPLQPDAQDMFSLIYQLAMKGPSDHTIDVTNGRKVYQAQFAESAEADYDTGQGLIRAIIVKAVRGDTVVETWLAPDFANQPVRILVPSKKIDLRAIAIDIDDNQDWRLPVRTQRKSNK